MTNATRYTAAGAQPAENFSDADNLIVKGNNLLALASLAKIFAGKVKCIYIDPPYNTGNDSFGYNDKFRHSTWLVFMKNRLELARKLLRDDGSIWISIDDDEGHYLKVLCDEIFGRDNFVATVIWEKKYSPQKFFRGKAQPFAAQFTRGLEHVSLRRIRKFAQARTYKTRARMRDGEFESEL